MGVVDNKKLYRLEVKKPSTTDSENNIVMNTEMVHLQVDLADKVKNPLIIKFNGGSTEDTNLFTYDGSTSKTVDISLTNLGAAASDHNHDDTYVNITGDTMTGTLTVPQINDINTSTAVSIATGTNDNSFFQTKKFRGEGDASTYYHAIDFGYAWHNRFDFYECGGVFNFWQNPIASKLESDANRVASLQLGKLIERGNTLTYPGKSGTLALTSDIEAETTRATAKETELEESIKQAGKVNDVTVNGTSVVTDKVANIDLSDYVDSERLESAVLNLESGILRAKDIYLQSVYYQAGNYADPYQLVFQGNPDSNKKIVLPTVTVTKTLIDEAIAAAQTTIAGKYVTIDTDQTITGLKTFAAPKESSGEQVTVIYNTANGGRIIFGKESLNGGTMIGLEQVSGTRRLNFCASSVAGSIVWSQPETNSTLYFDVNNITFRKVTDIYLTNYKNAGYLYTNSSGLLQTKAFPSIPTVNDAKLTIQAQGISVGTFTANQSTDTSINITTSSLGLDKVVNTGDSATPSENGTEKFTTGGAYALKTLIESKQPTLIFDSTPTANSTNPVTSKGIKEYVDNSIAAIDTGVHSVSIATGDNNGQVKLTVDGTSTNAFVKGLGSAAYTSSSNYATAAQGTKADNAMPKSGGAFTGAITVLTPSADTNPATKKYVDDAIGGVTSIDYLVVETLPETGQKGIIYLVAHSHGTQDIYDEYLWVTDKFEKIGNTDIDLSNYATKQYVTDSIGNLDYSAISVSGSETIKSISETNGIINVTKQNIQISESQVTNLTTDLAAKQNKFDADNKLSVDYISGLHKVATSGSYNDLSNKPTIPTTTSQLTNDSKFVTGVNVGSATQPVYINSSGAATACSTYGGGTAVTLNGTSKAGSTASFYAPTTAGTSGYFLKSNGSGAPIWAAITIPGVGDGKLTLSTSGIGLSGSASFSANQSSASAFTVAINSSTAGNRAANTIVATSAAGTIQSDVFDLSSSGTSKSNIIYNSEADCIEFRFV